MSPDSKDITFANVQAAAARLLGVVWHTPLLHSAWLSDAARGEVWLKLESMQATGSFKVRGAVNALAQIKTRSPECTLVVTASAGNHGLATAWAGRRFGIGARVHLPRSAPTAKKDALVRLGAELIEVANYDAAEASAREDAAARGAPYLPPYSDPDVIAGAGTIAIEMLSDQPSLDTIVVPLGGGGLLAGTAIIAKQAPHPVSVVGAESAASPCFSACLAAGEIVAVDVGPTIADGLAGNMDPHNCAFPIVRALVDRVGQVAESSIELAMRGLFTHERLIVEGAGAAGVAAILPGGLDLQGRRAGVILTGRNVDADVLRRVLA